MPKQPARRGLPLDAGILALGGRAHAGKQVSRCRPAGQPPRGGEPPPPRWGQGTSGEACWDVIAAVRGALPTPAPARAGGPAACARTPPDVWCLIDYMGAKCSTHTYGLPWGVIIPRTLAAEGVDHVLHRTQDGRSASVKGRQHPADRLTDRILAIFPEEKPLLRERGESRRGRWVGHPLLDTLMRAIPAGRRPASKTGLLGRRNIAPVLLPASRKPSVRCDLVPTLAASGGLTLQRQRPGLRVICAGGPGGIRKPPAGRPAAVRLASGVRWCPPAAADRLRPVPLCRPPTSP